MDMITNGEKRSAAGDLSFDHSNDPITQARNNLRYWTDRYPAGGPEVNNAARYMIETIDQHYLEPGEIEYGFSWDERVSADTDEWQRLADVYPTLEYAQRGLASKTERAKRLSIKKGVTWIRNISEITWRHVTYGDWKPLPLPSDATTEIGGPW